MSKLNPRRPTALAALAASGIFLAAALTVSAAETAESDVPPKKRTTLGLYVTAAQAYEMWKSAPDKVKVLDVRTPEEYTFVGHPEMALNIPFLFIVYQWDVEKEEYAKKLNPEFVAKVKEWAKPTDTILVTCRSGDRSTVAVDALAKAGFTNGFNVFDGMEGDTVKDPGNVYHGKRMKNGWRNSGLPWTYKVDPERAWLPEDEKP